MSDTRIDESRLLEMVRDRVLDRLGHFSRGKSFEEIAADVERISRFIIVPPEFMQLLREIASTPGAWGPGVLRDFLQINESDPRWKNLVTPDEKSEPEDSVPLYVRNFGFSFYRLDWIDGENSGRVEPGKERFVLEPYGYAIVGAGRSIDLGVPQSSNLAAFFVRDPVSGVSAAGKLPFVDDFDDAADAIIGVVKRMQYGRMGTTIEKNRFLRLEERLARGMTPHEFEMGRIVREFSNLEIPAERLTAGVVLFAGAPAKRGLGVPPSQALHMLAAMEAVGIGESALAMYRFSQGGFKLEFDAASGSVSAGPRVLLDLGGETNGHIGDLLRCRENFMSEAVERDLDDRTIRSIERYHLPVAVGRWWGGWGDLDENIHSLLEGLTLHDERERGSYLVESYQLWRQGLASLDADDGKAGSGGGGGMARGPSMRHELPEAVSYANRMDGQFVVDAAVCSGAAGFVYVPVAPPIMALPL